MKKLLLIGIVVALLVGALAAPSVADIRLKGGWFMPTDRDELHGNIPADGIFFGAEMVSSLGGTLGIGVGADYFQSSGTYEEGLTLPPVLVDISYRVIPITGTVYLYPASGLYIGGGIGYYLANSIDGGVSHDENGIGYHVVAGFQVSDQFFVEGKYSTCKISNWSDFDVGGISVAAGISL
jgi:hypothetical protein